MSASYTRDGTVAILLSLKVMHDFSGGGSIELLNENGWPKSQASFCHPSNVEWNYFLKRFQQQHQSTPSKTKSKEQTSLCRIWRNVAHLCNVSFFVLQKTGVGFQGAFSWQLCRWKSAAQVQNGFAHDKIADNMSLAKSSKPSHRPF